MTEYSAFGQLTIGQYLPYGSLVHRLDPRTKLVMFGLLVCAVTFANSYTASFLLLLALLGVVYLSRTPLRYALQGLRPALPWIAIFALLQLLFYHRQYGPDICTTIWRWGFVDITTCSLRQIGLMVLRLLEFMILISLLTLTTRTTELTHGLERLLSPLKRVGFPAHELALVFAISLRFAPTLAGELERIMKAQASRGADFGEQGRLGFIRRTRNLLPLLVPLFLSALRRAEDLTLAMEARGYTGGRGRTSFIQLKAVPFDYLALALVFVFSALMLFGGLESIDRQVFSAVSDCVGNVVNIVKS
jgi:energy-coupling factor transport system permease protein